MAITKKQYLNDYKEYYSFMVQKYSQMGFETYAQVFQDILELIDQCSSFTEFQNKFQEQDFTLKVGQAKTQDEGLIRQKGYLNTEIHVKRHYWSQDDSQVHYEQQEKLAHTQRAQFAEEMAQEAAQAKNLVDLTQKVNQSNQKQGTMIAADEIYQAFEVEMILLEYYNMLNEAEVPQSGYPEATMPEKDFAQELGVPTPTSYPESLAMYIKGAQQTLKETRQSIEDMARQNNSKYDYNQLWEARHRRAYSLTDAVLQDFIETSKKFSGGDV